MIEEHLAHRDRLWPDASQRVWHWAENKGYVHVPRLLPLVMVLIRTLCPKGNPAMVYFELWSRCMDGGFLELDDEESHAYASGYAGQRAIRTWREQVRSLQKLGFIETKSVGNREFGYVLLIDPIRVCMELRNAGKPRIPDSWWAAFVSRANKIGANISG